MKLITVNRNIGFKERRYIEELRILTGAVVFDCIIDERFNRVIYVIKTGDMGLAIGRKGDNIRKMEKVLGRRVEMVEYDPDPDQFLRNIFKPADVTRFDESGDGVITAYFGRKSDLGIAIGKGGCNIEKARLLCTRLCSCTIGDLLISGDEHESV